MSPANAIHLAGKALLYTIAGAALGVLAAFIVHCTWLMLETKTSNNAAAPWGR
jgi:hypothetical protein